VSCIIFYTRLLCKNLKEEFLVETRVSTAERSEYSLRWIGGTSKGETAGPENLKEE